MGRHESDTTTARPRWLIPVVALAVVIGGVGTWWTLARSGSGSTSGAAGTVSASQLPTGASCSAPTTIQVSVAGPLVSAVKTAAGLAQASGACATYAVTAEAAPVTAASLAAGKGPNVWIPDSSAWVNDVTSKAPNAVTIGPAVALSPLVLALPKSLAGSVTTAPSWAELVAFKVPVLFADPTASTSSRLALSAAYAALGTSSEARIALGAAMIRLSRTKVASDDLLYQRAESGATPVVAFPAEEAAIAAYNAAHPSTPLSVTIPADGTSAFDHPFLTVGTPTAAVKAGADALLAALQSDPGKAAVVAAGFRTGLADATGKVAHVIGGAPTYLPPPPAEAVAALQRSWAAVGTEMRMLAVVDTSGSMKDPAGASTRMALAHQAGLVALSAFPPGSVIGLWRFGYQLGGPTQDWQVMVPQRGLNDVTGGKDQRTLLVEGFAKLAARPGGSTGLYDTILAAYEQAKAGYDPTRVNSVVLLTDGKNEDPRSITLDDLLAKLAAAKDPAKPIVVITVAIGPDADAATLQRVTQVTGGRSYTATAPEQITGVFVDALLNRS
ncbi:MAG: substrate-binding domain-containing protein [Actinomycetales bacterium]|nr:substrate-binding domain-containing protein [Candidatus Phosphoribacter baldrii]